MYAILKLPEVDVPSQFKDFRKWRKFQPFLCHRPESRFGVPVDLYYPKFSTLRHYNTVVDIDLSDFKVVEKLTLSMPKAFISMMLQCDTFLTFFF